MEEFFDLTMEDLIQDVGAKYFTETMYKMIHS